MKKLAFLTSLLLYYSCTPETQQVSQPVDTTSVVFEPAPPPAFVRPPKETTVYYFGAVKYIYLRDIGHNFHKVQASRVLTADFREGEKLSEDEKYRLLDDITSDIINPEGIEERKVYEYGTYKEASEKRQQVIKEGTN